MSTRILKFLVMIQVIRVIICGITFARMIDWLVYLATGGILGAIIAFVIAMFKIGPGKPEFPMAKVTLACILFTLGSPFAYMWIQGKRYKAVLLPTVKNYFRSERCPLQGKIEEVRIMHVAKNTAYVLLVSREAESWGGYDYPIMKIKMGRNEKSGKWYVDKGIVLRSSRLNKDELIWPPFK
jgi:hypothetical protein